MKAEKQQQSSFLILKKKISNLPEPNKFFSGREKEIGNIASALTNDALLVIQGISGIGKTQLAKQYAHSHLKDYDLIWWFDADKNMETQVDALLHEIFRRKHKPYYRPASLQDLANKLKHELSVLNASWLLIFDNIDDMASMSQFDPFNQASKADKNFQKHVIVTYKKRNKMYPSLMIDKFQRKESIAFLSKILEEEKAENLHELARVLEDFPLALTQAASYIKMNPSIKAKTYIQLFKESYSELWKAEEKLIEGQQKRKSLEDNYNKTISTAIKMNIASIKDRSLLAYQILCLCSLLNHQQIPIEVLERWVCGKRGASRIEFHEGLSILLNYFLLEEGESQRQEQESKLFNQHELIQLIALETIDKDLKKVLLTEAAECTLQELISMPGTLFEQFRGREYFFNHIDKLYNLATMLNYNSKNLKELKIALLYLIHFFQRDFDLSSKFIADLKDSVENDKDLSPVAQLWFYCALSNDQMFEDLLEVQRIHQQGLKCLKKIQEEETKKGYFIHLNTNFVESLSNFGKIKAAISLCDSLEETLKTSNNKSEKTAFLGVSAITRLKYGQYDQTLKDLDHCLELISKEKGDEKFIPLLMLVKAHCLLYQTQTQKAYQIIEEYYPYLLEIFTTPECMVLVKSKFIKGACLASLGKLDEAQRLVEQTLECYEKASGFDNDTLKGMGYRVLGEIFEAKGDLTKAYEEYIKAEHFYDKILQEKSLDELSLLYTRLAILGAKLGDDMMVGKYLSFHIENFGLSHPRTFEIKRSLDSRGLTLP